MRNILLNLCMEPDKFGSLKGSILEPCWKNRTNDSSKKYCMMFQVFKRLSILPVDPSNQKIDWLDKVMLKSYRKWKTNDSSKDSEGCSIVKNQIADLSVTVDSTSTSNQQLHSVISSTVPITQKPMLQVSTIS